MKIFSGRCPAGSAEAQQVFAPEAADEIAIGAIVNLPTVSADSQ